MRDNSRMPRNVGICADRGHLSPLGLRHATCAAGMLRVDAHHHLWRYHPLEFGWIEDAASALRRDFLPDSGNVVHLSTPDPTHIFAPPLPPVETTEASTSTSSEALSRSVHIPSPAIPPSLRLEQGFTAPGTIGVFYDPMIAKLVVHASTRNEALRVLRKALEEYKVVGVNTNVEFLRALAGHESFEKGDVETGFIKVRLLH